MPRSLNPATLKTGHGKALSNEHARLPALTGAGLAGPGPNIGEQNTPTIVLGNQGNVGLRGHIQDPKEAHPASAIAHDGFPDILLSRNVEGALDELIGTVTDRPPYLGQWSRHSTFTGIPDWGFLKLRDQSLEYFNQLSEKPLGVSASDLFPYFHEAPGPARDGEFTQIGGDPRTDHLWNDGAQALGEPGMGWGRAHIGAFTRDGEAGPAPLTVFRTARLFPRPTGVDGETGRPERVPVTVSGTIFPADRGVLALFHMPPGGDLQTAFLAQPLISDHTSPLSPQGRVVAALLLGNGVMGDKCLHHIGDCDDPHVCDGEPGGVFAVGSASGHYNPFAFPGRATGQYDLEEIHTGIDADGDPLKAPFNDLDGDAVDGAARAPNATVPAPGQVRLGTDPDSGVDTVENGIPILGGTVSAYTVAPTPQNGSLGEAIHGDTLVRSSNFFGYRLPVLKDYSQNTGLKWTPRGETFATKETQRFFTAKQPHASSYPDGSPLSPGGNLSSAGFYGSAFSEDYWVWQVARYRHTFLMPSIELDGDREEVGTYWLVHFKTERDFERLARDGVFPWDADNGYEVYGFSLVDTDHVEEDGNIANEWPAATPPVAPDGPAPSYGYAANPYHQLRSSIFMDPVGEALPAINSEGWAWNTTASLVTDAVMWVSGVAYFTPRVVTDGNPAFALTDITYKLDPGFWTSYRTDSDDLSGVGNTAPAVIGSMNPLFINNAPFAYGVHPSTPGAGSSLDLTLDVPGAGHVPDATYQRRFRWEVPFTFLGSNGGGLFTDANGPLDADQLSYSTSAVGDIPLVGDDTEPAFTRDAAVRVYLRRPLTHTTETTAILPFGAVDGHGQRLTESGGDTILLHSTRFDQTNKVGLYGNFVQNALGAPPNTSYVELYPASKDATEKFLDETYRLRGAFPNSLVGHATYTQEALDSLTGPGMAGWVGGPIEIPIKIGLATSPWDEFSFLLMEDHLVDLSGGPSDLQIAGLPDRNPPISACVQVPFPSCGMLLYPRTDYTVSHAPLGGAHMADNQPDYSGATGDRTFLRCLDVAFSHNNPGFLGPQEMVGQTECILRLDGITLEDIAYSAPGPGGVVDDRITILVKLPGLTTWMDVGRPDGSGPDKQDPNLDGAGCQIQDSRTYDFKDPVTGYMGCFVAIHVGPVASFFETSGDVSGYTSGSVEGEVPLMVKVIMGENSTNYDLEHLYDSGVFGGVRPGAAPDSVRGLIGIRILHPDESPVAALEEEEVGFGF